MLLCCNKTGFIKAGNGPDLACGQYLTDLSSKQLAVYTHIVVQGRFFLKARKELNKAIISHVTGAE